MSNEEIYQLTIKKAAETELQYHEIREVSMNGVYRTFDCSRKDTSHFSFQITTIPNRLILTGTLGTLCLRNYLTYDIVPFVRNVKSVSDIVDNEFKISSFNPIKVRDWIEHQKLELHTDEWVLLLKELASMNDETILCLKESSMLQRFGAFWSRHEVEMFRIYTRKFLIQNEMIRWFCKNYTGPVIGDQDATELCDC